VLDDGRLTDSKGNVVNFRNTIIIFTSNVGSREILEKGVHGKDAETTAAVMAALRQQFRPEFLNRIDEFVTFRSLGKEQLRSIVDLEMRRVQARLAEKELVVDMTDAAKDWLAEVAYDPAFGARPLKRTVVREVETPLAKMLLSKKLPPGSRIAMDKRVAEAYLHITT
jgi:ATP-dependent Clp protease ATP-binding subunit ClpB